MQEHYVPGKYILAPEQLEFSPYEFLGTTPISHLRLHHLDTTIQAVGYYVDCANRNPGLPTYNPEKWTNEDRFTFLTPLRTYIADHLNVYIAAIQGDQQPPHRFDRWTGAGTKASTAYAEDLLGKNGLYLLEYAKQELRFYHAFTSTPGETIVTIDDKIDDMCLACQSTSPDHPGKHCSIPEPKTYTTVDDWTYRSLASMTQRSDIQWAFDIEQMHIVDSQSIQLPMALLRSEAFLRAHCAYRNHLLNYWGISDIVTEPIYWEFSNIIFGKPQ